MAVREQVLEAQPLVLVRRGRDLMAVHQLLYLAMALHLEAAVEVHLR